MVLSDFSISYTQVGQRGVCSPYPGREGVRGHCILEHLTILVEWSPAYAGTFPTYAQ